MTQVTVKKLPNGSVPTQGVADVQARSAMMKMNENIVALKKQLELAQKAIQEMQKEVF